MRRREFLALLGALGSAWPLIVQAQQSERVRRIGLLSAAAANDPEGQRYRGALVQGLQKLGWIEDRNFQIEVRRATGGTTTQDLADDLVRAQPDVIIAPSTVGVKLLQQATRTIPIVFINVSDPVRDGFVASLARPGGNITGVSSTEPAMTGKWYELLKAIAPQTTRALILFNPNTAPHSLYLEPLKTEAPSFRLEAVPAPVLTRADIEGALAQASGSAGWGMISLPDSFLWFHRQLIADLAAQHRIPAVYPLRAHALSGGLVSYGADFVDQWARAASYIDRILKGERAADLPIQTPVKFETIVNLRTARALGLQVPDLLLAGADEIIE
jgi:putative ABC transport system substrate-binding protein